MYDRSDPRAALSAGAPAAPMVQPSFFAAPEYGRFYEQAPSESSSAGKSWYIRGQNFVLGYTEAEAGSTFGRTDQADEYVLILPDRETRATVRAGGETKEIEGFSVIMVPPGESSVTMTSGGRFFRLATTRGR